MFSWTMGDGKGRREGVQGVARESRPLGFADATLLEGVGTGTAFNGVNLQKNI